MKKRVLPILVVVLLFLTSCRVQISLDGTRFINHSFFARINFEALSIESSDSVGLTTEQGETKLAATQNVKLVHLGITRNFKYKNTILADKNATDNFDVFNRAYNVYKFGNDVEYWILSSTKTICGYRNYGADETKDEKLSSIGFKANSDEFLYHAVSSTWRQEYTAFRFVMPSVENPYYTAFYIKEYEGYATDDVLKVEVTKSGEVRLFEAFGLGKYDYLQNTILKSDLDSSADALKGFLSEKGLDAYNCSDFCIVTDNKGGVYLKSELTDNDGNYYDTVFVNISVPTVKMSEEYAQMVSDNLDNNKALDDASETTTKDKIINNQNSDAIASFKYGRFSASYNACGAIAIHNAKVLLKIPSTLSQTIYDIETGYGVTFGGVFGSDDGLVPEMMKKYGIKCTETEVEKANKKGVYIISFWHKDPPWNGIHIIAVRYEHNVYTAYNFLGDGSVKPIDIASIKDRVISCYKIESN